MGFLIIVVIIAVFIALAVYAHHAAQVREQALRDLAQRHGWQFSADHDRSLKSQYADFSCLQQGDGQYAYNLLAGSVGERQVRGFDYHYETHSTDSKGNSETQHHYFSALFLEVDVSFKPLFIRSENLFDKIGHLIGFHDIDFESDEFNRQFCVKAQDHRWAFDVISQSTMEFLLAAPCFAIQFAGSQVLAYRDSLFEADDFEQALAVLSGILDRLPASVVRELKGATP